MTPARADVVGLLGRRQVVLLAPPVLIVSMYGAFQSLTRVFGFPVGYLLAFVVYWLGWCVCFPAAILGPRAALALFGASAPITKVGRRGQVLLWWPLVFPLYFSFIHRIAGVSAAVVSWSVVLGTVTGVAEELLWRGLYVRLFPDSVWLSTVYPSIAFGLWHLCPLSSVPSRFAGGAPTFVLYSVALGVSYAASARRLHSIRWCAVSHSIHDSLGLGALAYVR
jgi:CAAX protease family protein